MKNKVIFTLLALLLFSWGIMGYFGLKFFWKKARSIEQVKSPLADELALFLEKKWVEKYRTYQSQFDLEGKSAKDLEEMGKTIKEDFFQWIQARPHVKEVKSLEEVRVDSTKDYIIKSVSFINANGLTVTGHLSIPVRKKDSLPALMIPNGMGSSSEKIFGLTGTDYHSNVGKCFSKDFIVFAVNIPPATGPFKKTVKLMDRNFYLSNSAGLNWKYYQIVDKVSSALDYVENLPGYNGRAAIYGISMGGGTAIVSSLFEPRIKVVVPSGTNVFTPTDVQLLKNRRFVYTHYYEYNVVSCPSLFQLLFAMYPRQIVIELNKLDVTGVYNEALKAANQVRKFYEIRGRKNNVQLVLFEGQKFRNGHYMEVNQVKKILKQLL